MSPDEMPSAAARGQWIGQLVTVFGIKGTDLAAIIIPGRTRLEIGIDLATYLKAEAEA